MKKIKGEDIMVFVPGATSGTSKSIAFATNHVLTINASLDNGSTNKDENAEWEQSTVQTRNWTVTSDNLYAGENYDELFDIMISGTPVNIVFGHKKQTYKSLADGNLDHWTPDDGHSNGYLYEGKALISSLTWNAEAGSQSTLSVEFTGSGELKKKQ